MALSEKPQRATRMICAWRTPARATRPTAGRTVLCAAERICLAQNRGLSTDPANGIGVVIDKMMCCGVGGKPPQEEQQAKLKDRPGS